MTGKGKINRDILILSILTVITVFTWIAFDVYKALTKYTLPKVLEKQMKTLNPKIDRVQIEKLKTRLSIPKEELEKISLPSLTPEVTPEATPATEILEGTRSATPSGRP